MPDLTIDGESGVGDMPRDLSTTSPPPPPTTASPETATPTGDDTAELSRPTISLNDEDEDDEFTQLSVQQNNSHPFLQHLRNLQRPRQASERGGQMCPYVQTLSLADLNSCYALEQAIFPPQEQCSREKFAYRLSTCPELCLGLFTSLTSAAAPEEGQGQVSTFEAARAADSYSPDRRQVLIGMIIATKSTSRTVTDASMMAPKDFVSSLPQKATTMTSSRGDSSSSSAEATKASHAASASTLATQQQTSLPIRTAERIQLDPDEAIGSEPHGRTLLVHTFGILPLFQGKGLGRVLMRSYQQRMETCGIADRISIIVHENSLVDMYKSMGFERGEGLSDVKFGGGGWVDMVYEFSDHKIGS